MILKILALIDYVVYRHQGVSLELLIKLVRVFGSVIYSSLSASSSVGVDIEAEQRCALILVILVKLFSFCNYSNLGFYFLIGAKA